MSALAAAAADYLRLRNRLGHKLAEYHWLLPRFVAYLDEIDAPTVTIAAALAWAQAPEVDPSSSMAARRMTIARGFARYMAGLNPCTEVPPAGLIAWRRTWHPPFLFGPNDIDDLLAAARCLHYRLASATHETLLGLLAATGMRVGEAIRLDRGDIDWDDAILLIRESKFGKSRMIPVQPSTLAALDAYERTHDRHHPHLSSRAFFVSIRGTRTIYQCVHEVFRNLCDTTGIGTDTVPRPRIHDLRHTFAVRTLLDWYHAGGWAIGLMLAIVAVVSLVCTYLLPETKGTALRFTRGADDAFVAS